MRCEGVRCEGVRCEGVERGFGGEGCEVYDGI